MGHGSVSSAHWDSKRQHTPTDLAIYWQGRAMQYKAEVEHLSKAVDRLDRVNQHLSIEISKVNSLLVTREAELKEYRQTFGPIILFSTFDSEERK